MHRQPNFCLFGLGHRRKLLYRSGLLIDAITGEVLRRWNVVQELLEPAEYRITLSTPRGQVRLFEDEQAVWLEDDDDRHSLTASPIRLPHFDAHPQAAALRILHAEILLNVMPFGPVPNLWTYPRPWYRDAAMMLMVLKHSGNLHLVEPWVNGLHKPFDRNNSGMAEPDNLGQLLYMICLVSDARHPLVSTILKEAEKLRQGDHISGLSDYAPHPVYQTKWLKYGLRSLGLDDPYKIPQWRDSYSSLFWMDYRDEHVECTPFGADALQKYPYLNWAEAHFHNAPPPAEFSPRFPMTWERDASEADYWRMGIVGNELVTTRTSTPHTWHAAEMFLYLLDHPQPA